METNQFLWLFGDNKRLSTTPLNEMFFFLFVGGELWGAGSSVKQIQISKKFTSEMFMKNFTTQ